MKKQIAENLSNWHFWLLFRKAVKNYVSRNFRYGEFRHKMETE